MSVHTPYQKHTWVTKEIIRREYLQNIEDGIYQEQQDAEAAETRLENALNTEELRAKAKETEIANNLTQEISRATAAEQDLLDGVQGSITELSERISNEYTRATEVESSLQTATSQNTLDIATEVARATAAEAALQNDIDTKIAGAYKPSGSLYFADLPSLVLANEGKVYYVMDAFTTTADFIDGAGIDYPAGTYVAIINTGTTASPVFMYDAMSGIVDTSNFVQKTDKATDTTLGIVKPDGTTVTVDANGVLSSTGSSVSPQGLGFGYGTSVTAAATVAKEATLTGYNLIKHGYVSIKFSNAVPASSTLNINSKGAKPIYYHGAAITANIIGAGDLATFVYDGTNYNLVGVDSASSQIQAIEAQESDIVNVLGAKNLLPNNATSQTMYGVTYTVNSDGSVTANGTATASATFPLVASFTVPKDGSYTLSGITPNVGDLHYGLIVYDVTDSDKAVLYIQNTQYTIESATLYSSHTYRAILIIFSGYTASNLTFYPMIRPASIVDDTYVPYAMTNKELTDQVNKREVLVLEASGWSSLPRTITNSAIETDMVCIQSELSNPSAQVSDWTVNTDTAGSCTVSGTISGSTNIKLYLMKSR